MFRRITLLKTPLTLQKRVLQPSYQLSAIPRFRFSESNNKNYEELMSQKGKVSTTSIAIGFIAATSLLAYIILGKKPQEKSTQSSTSQESNSDHLHISAQMKEKIDPTGKNSIATAERLQQNAKEKFSLGEYDETFDLIDLAIRVLQDIGGQDTVQEGNLYFDLGFYRFHGDQRPEAMEAFDKAYNIYDKLGQKDKVIDTLDFLALLYQYKTVEAEEFYEKNIKKRQEIFSGTDPEVARAYIQYGMWHLGRLRNSKGVQYLDQAHEVLKKADKGDKGAKDKVGLVYKQLMNAYKEASSYPLALEAANKAIEYSDEQNQPALLEDIAIIYSKANDMEKSVEYYEKHVQALKKLGKNQAEIGRGIKETAAACEKKTDLEKATQYWKEFSNLFKDEDNRDVAALSIYGNLRAFALYNRGDKIKEANKELENSYQRASKLLGNDHLYTICLKKVFETYNHSQENGKPKLDMQHLSLLLLALEDNLEKLVDTGFIQYQVIKV